MGFDFEFQIGMSEPSGRGGPLGYEPATLLKMTATAETHNQILFQDSLLDSPIMSDKIVPYHYTIRMGTQRYNCRYTPTKQPGDMPDAWWKGNAPVQVRVEGHTRFIQQPKGIRVESQIVGQAADK
jgi:hypothetical protein